MKNYAETWIKRVITQKHKNETEEGVVAFLFNIVIQVGEIITQVGNFSISSRNNSTTFART